MASTKFLPLPALREEFLFHVVVRKSSRKKLHALWVSEMGTTLVRPNSALLTDAYLALRASFGAANRER
jgi:hypothetical protein